MRHQLALALAVAAPTAGLAAAGQAPDPTRVDLLPADEEKALALSAAPPHLRAGATVWALGPKGFEKVQEGTNGFTCVVNRDHPLNRKPTCYDEEGTATILPVVLRSGEMFLHGATPQEVRKEIDDGLRSGKYRSPGRPGVAYMLSTGIRTYNPRTGRFGTFPPHVMFYAPNLTNADIGWTPEARFENPSLPFIAYQGPQGFMIVRMPEPPTGDQAP